MRKLKLAKLISISSIISVNVMQGLFSDQAGEFARRYIELNPMNGPEGGGQKHRMRQEQARIDELPTILYYMDGCVYSVSRNVY